MCSLDVNIHFAVLASRIVFGNAGMNVQNVERLSSHNGICKKILNMTIWYVIYKDYELHLARYECI